MPRKRSDYFNTESVGYAYLSAASRSITEMPGLLARRLKMLIDRGYVRVIIATSTLSEGVTIPVSYLLISSVYRSNDRLTLQELRT